MKYQLSIFFIKNKKQEKIPAFYFNYFYIKTERLNAFLL